MAHILKLDLNHVLDRVNVEKNEVLRRIKAVDDKLNSPGYSFLRRFQPDILCSCETTKKAGPPCPCPPEKGKMAFNLSERPAQEIQNPCLPNCPNCQTLCRCGINCPSKPGQFEKPPERTFHVPGCPGDRMMFTLQQPRSPVAGMKACPFSPACCPIGEVCPFPVNTLFDINAPPLPSVESRRCPRVPTINSDNTTDCVLNPLKNQSPRNCPLVPSSGCPLAQQSDCPLLSCSLGPLKSFIFDGNDKCPFCQSKCCPMITPDGPGCPIGMIPNICGTKGSTCCLEKFQSPKNITAALTTDTKEETCPIGDMLAANSRTNRCGCSGRQNLASSINCPLSNQKSSCNCGTNTAESSLNRPESCPLRGMKFGNNNACPLTKTSVQCALAQRPNNFEPSCPATGLFECPALRNNPKTITGTVASSKHIDLQARQEQAGDTLKKNLATVDDKKQMAFRSYSTQFTSTCCRINNTSNKINFEKQYSSMLTTQNADPTAVNLNKASINVTKSFLKSNGISLESLPHPPQSDDTLQLLINASSHSRNEARPKKGDVLRLVGTTPQEMAMAFLDDYPNGKLKPKNCPMPEPEPCALETQKCPFSPLDPSCPLARKTTCPLLDSQQGGILGSKKLDCPVETEPCNLFPSGHCPMEDMRMCECAYPVSPCMVPALPKEAAEAKDQYCSRLNCCMGLPLPPIKPSDEIATEKWYAFKTLPPRGPITKYCLEILDVPPEPEFFVSVNESRKHPAWKILKYGEGYMQCKGVQDIITARGPTNTTGTQFDEDDLPDDEEIHILEQNRKEAEVNIKKVAAESIEVPWIT